MFAEKREKNVFANLCRNFVCFFCPENSFRTSLQNAECAASRPADTRARLAGTLFYCGRARVSMQKVLKKAQWAAKMCSTPRTYLERENECVRQFKYAIKTFFFCYNNLFNVSFQLQNYCGQLFNFSLDLLSKS